MPLTLRLYDADDVEIAWIRADPYEWEMTHPDPGWDRLDRSIATKEDATEMFSLPLETDQFSGHFDCLRTHDETPRDHLEWAQENLEARPDVDSTMLINE